jgi:hypothetical protein
LPSDFSTIIKCPSIFQSVTIRKSATITVPPGCQVDLKSHIITPDSATTDSDLETIHCEWSWDSKHNCNFNRQHQRSSGNKTVEQCFKDLENIRLDENKPITSVDNVFITVLAFVSIATCYLLFKICFTWSHSIKPLFPTFRPREWTKRSRKRSFDKMNKDSKKMEPLGPNRESETNIYPNIYNTGETTKNSANFHNMKF